jgi:hypothetical protein
MSIPTIVTAVYNIRKQETNSQQNNRSYGTYVELADQFILKLPYPLYVFVSDDEDGIELEHFIYYTRLRSGIIDKTYVHRINLQDTYFYRYIDQIKDAQCKFYLINGHLSHETPLYITLNNNKFFFIGQAISKNIFNTSHFVWIDFGINHVARNTEEIHNWITNVPDKVKQMCINPYLETHDRKAFFQYIYHHTAGGLFSGSATNLLQYVKLYTEMYELILRQGWYQIDEAVMTMVQRDNPNLFEFYYGDYQGIVSNYLRPIHNLDLINIMLEKAKRFENLPLVNHINEFLSRK